MGQVPKKTYGIIGSGKTAKHFKYYFQSCNIFLRTWSRSENKNTPEESLRNCDTILILIKDSEIPGFIQANPWLKQKEIVHFSGSLVLDGIQSAHPLMTLGDSLYSLDTYRSIAFICEKGKKSFREIFPELENTYFEIESSKKPLYHSLCVLSGNFTTLLWKKFFEQLEHEFHIPYTAAFPYMEKIIKNVQKNPQGALTGPLVRRDYTTIRKNLEALEGDPYHEIYKTFVKTYDPKILENL